MPKVRASSGMIGHDAVAQAAVAHQLREDADEGHRVGGLALAGTVEELLEELVAGGAQRAGRDASLRHGAAQGGGSPLPQVAHLGAVLGGAVERRAHDLRVRSAGCRSGRGTAAVPPR